MDRLVDFIMNNVERGDCQCGKCVDAPEKPKQPVAEHTADLCFFKVALRGEPSRERLAELVRANVKGEFADMDLLDGKERGYMDIGGWIGDQGLALMLMGAGSLLGLWELRTPMKMLGMGSDDPLCQQLAGAGMVTIKAADESEVRGG